MKLVLFHGRAGFAMTDSFALWRRVWVYQATEILSKPAAHSIGATGSTLEMYILRRLRR